MEFLEQNIIPPTPEHLGLLKFLRVLILFIHFPYMGIVLGSAVCSVVFVFLGSGAPGGTYSRAAKDLSLLAGYGRSAAFFLGIVPMVTSILISRQLLYQSGVTVLHYQLYALPFVLAGFVCLSFYRVKGSCNSEDPGLRTSLGILGIIFLLAGYLLFLASLSRFIDPEKWPFIDNPAELVLSWHVIARYKLFLASAFGITGSGVLLFLLDWREVSNEPVDSHSRFMMFFGAGLTLFFVMLLPLFWLWYLATSPDASLSYEIFILSSAAFFLLLVAGLAVYGVIKSRRQPYGVLAFIALVMVFLTSVMVDHYTLETAMTEHSIILKAMAEERAEAHELEHEGEEAVVGEKVEVKGAALFEDLCSMCHSFTEEVVGPPLGDVVPKYLSDIEGLKAFLKQPTKKDPDYPEMPELGLEEEEIEAIVDYLLHEIKEKR